MITKLIPTPLRGWSRLRQKPKTLQHARARQYNYCVYRSINASPSTTVTQAPASESTTLTPADRPHEANKPLSMIVDQWVATWLDGDAGNLKLLVGLCSQPIFHSLCEPSPTCIFMHCIKKSKIVCNCEQCCCGPCGDQWCRQQERSRYRQFNSYNIQTVAGLQQDSGNVVIVGPTLKPINKQRVVYFTEDRPFTAKRARNFWAFR